MLMLLASDRMDEEKGAKPRERLQQIYGFFT